MLISAATLKAVSIPPLRAGISGRPASGTRGIGGHDRDQQSGAGRTCHFCRVPKIALQCEYRCGGGGFNLGMKAA